MGVDVLLLVEAGINDYLSRFIAVFHLGLAGPVDVAPNEDADY